VNANLGLVMSLAKRLVGHGLALHDLVQEGNLGLMKAVDKFDHHRGLRFGTYAVWWVRQQLTRAIVEQAKTIRVPAHLAAKGQRVRRLARAFEAMHGRAPTEAELGEQSGLVPEKVRAALATPPEPISLDAPTRADDEGRLGDRVPDRSTPAPDEQIAGARMREETRRLLDRLTPREQEVLRRRFGLDDGPEQTLAEIGASLSVSRERVRQIEAEALRKLRQPSQAGELDSYLAA
jgi:RNA polymerase primary sigma factor